MAENIFDDHAYTVNQCYFRWSWLPQLSLSGLLSFLKYEGLFLVKLTVLDLDPVFRVRRANPASIETMKLNYIYLHESLNFKSAQTYALGGGLSIWSATPTTIGSVRHCSLVSDLM